MTIAKFHKNIHILIICSLNKSEKIKGGLELYLERLIEIFNEMNVKIFLAAPCILQGAENYLKINPEKKYFFKTIEQLNNYIKKNTINLIISNDCYSDFLAGWLKLSNSKIIFASIIHDVYYSENMSILLKIKKKNYCFIDGILLKFFDYKIFYSIVLYRKYTDSKTIFFNAGLFKKNYEYSIATLEKPRKKKIIGWIGRPDIIKKGLDIFLKISEKLDSDKYEFVIAGIEKTRHIENLLPNNVNIKFCGYLTNPAEFYEAVDIVILPSRYESLGFTAIEAIYYCKIVILSDIPSFNNLLKLINYPLKPVKLNDIDEYVKRIQNCRIAEEELKKYSILVSEIFSFDTLKKNCLNFIDNIVF